MRGFAVFIFLITFASHLLVIFVWLDEKVSCYQSPFIVAFHSAHTPTMGAPPSFAAQRDSANKDSPLDIVTNQSFRLLVARRVG